jgi:hypothetical protein
MPALLNSSPVAPPQSITTASSPLSPSSFGSPGAQATNSTVDPSVHEN